MENDFFFSSIPLEFWKMIRDAGQDPGKFRNLLGHWSRDKIIQFYWTYEEVANHLRTERFLPYVHPDLSEDGLAELANWVVAQGKDYYENILRNPEKIPAKKDDAGFLSELVEEYEERFADDLPINLNFWDVKWKQNGKESPWD